MSVDDLAARACAEVQTLQQEFAELSASNKELGATITDLDEVIALLHELASEGATLALITHDEHIAETFPRRLQMRDGEIVEQLPIEAVREQNVAHEYTRSLLLATQGYRRKAIDPA